MLGWDVKEGRTICSGKVKEKIQAIDIAHLDTCYLNIMYPSFHSTLMKPVHQNTGREGRVRKDYSLI